jgi:hypothetical protein
VYKQYYNLAMVEAVEPFKMHPTSMSYLYKVFEHLQPYIYGMFEHLQLLGMGICTHIHSITTTDVPQICES